MKRVRSIFGIFTVFLLIILASFLLLSWQSTANLKASLIQTAQLQTKYAATLLEQKGKEIEIEADGILYGENMQNLYAAIENNDVYEYVQQINKMKSFFQERQGRTVGMSGMTLYWPKSGREISTLRQGYFEDSFWENNKESQWKSANKQEIFYMRRRTVEWRGEDQEVWLVLRMDQDFLYEIKEMAAGMDQGGSILMFGGEINVLSQKSVEQNIAGIIRQSNEKVCEVRVGKQKYQIVRSDETKNGMQLVSYYPTRQMMRQVRNIMTISGIMLGAILIFGMIYISLFVKNRTVVIIFGAVLFYLNVSYLQSIAKFFSYWNMEQIFYFPYGSHLSDYWIILRAVIYVIIHMYIFTIVSYWQLKRERRNG